MHRFIRHKLIFNIHNIKINISLVSSFVFLLFTFLYYFRSRFKKERKKRNVFRVAKHRSSALEKKRRKIEERRKARNSIKGDWLLREPGRDEKARKTLRARVCNTCRLPRRGKHRKSESNTVAILFYYSSHPFPFVRLYLHILNWYIYRDAPRAVRGFDEN